MWIEGWGRTSLTIHQTFSEMLALNPYVQQLYIAWCAFYSVGSLLLLYFCLRYYWHAGIPASEIVQEGPDQVPTSWCCKKDPLKALYVAVCTFYTCLTVIKLGCAWAIAWVPVNAPNPLPHQILAAFAFGSAIFIEVLLFVRRLVLHGLLGSTSAKKHLGIFYYSVNGIVVGVLVGLGITFCVIRTGEYEFTIMLLVILGPLFQLYDFFFDEDLKGRYFHKGGIAESHPTVVIPLSPVRPNKKSGSWLQNLFYKRKVG
jgi:hypothetical protein